MIDDGERWMTATFDAPEGATLKVEDEGLAKFLRAMLVNVPQIADGCDRIEVSFHLVNPHPEVERGKSFANTRRNDDGTLTTERDGERLTRRREGEALNTLRERLGVDGNEVAAMLKISAADMIARERGDVALTREMLQTHVAAVVLAAGEPPMGG